MTNIFDYLKWRGDVTFDAYPLNEVDSVIFSQLCYVPFDRIVSEDPNAKGKTIEDIYDNYFDIVDEKISLGAIIPTDKIMPLFEMLSHSARFKDVVIRAYVNEIELSTEKQFSAMCLDIPDSDITYVAFRGTDDTLVGWKEDFNMSLFTPVPSQKDGVAYLNRVGNATERRLCLGGHSKGGNIAIYASFMADEAVQDKIVSVHNFDGPGFRYEFLNFARQNKKIEKKITNFLPDSSIIGSIFDTIGRRIYVKSSSKGLFQHDTFSWHLERINFITVSSLAKSSTQFHNSLEQWISGLSDEEKRDFVEALFKLIAVNDAGTLSDILSNKFKFIVALFKADDKSKKTVWKTALGFLGMKKKKGAKNLTEHDKEILQKANLLETPESDE